MSVAPAPYQPFNPNNNPIEDEPDVASTKLMIEILNQNLSDLKSQHYAEQLQLSLLLDTELELGGGEEDDDRMFALRLALDGFHSLISASAIDHMNESDVVNAGDAQVAHSLSQHLRAIARKECLDHEFALELKNRGANVLDSLDVEETLGEDRVRELMVRAILVLKQRYS